MEPTYEELKARLAQLEQQVSAKNRQLKQIEYRVTLDEGDVQIRNLTRSLINIPADVLKALFEQAKPLMEFMKNQAHLLSSNSDSEDVVQHKLQLREENLNSTNPVVAKPRADKGKPKNRQVV